MLDTIRALGAEVEQIVDSTEIRVVGMHQSANPAATIRIHANQSGTTSRFVLPVLAALANTGELDGDEQLRGRPFGQLTRALRALGATVNGDSDGEFLPLQVHGPARGGTVEISGAISSQFVSGLLIAGPLYANGVDIRVSDHLVSEPYVELTRSVMRSFGISIDGLTVANQPYRSADYTIEPDASSASYFFALAAITGGRITIDGLGSETRQGDIGFVDVLEQMGARVERKATSTTVTGPPPGRLQGVDVDMRHISDTAQTLAAAAVFANSATRVHGIGFIRGKETDRISAIVTELQRAGIGAVDDGDGFTIHPGRPKPAVLNTYDDHRMAMSLSLLGLKVPGIVLANPSCVAKTYPDYFDDIERLARPISGQQPTATKS